MPRQLVGLDRPGSAGVEVDPQEHARTNVHEM